MVSEMSGVVESGVVDDGGSEERAKLVVEYLRKLEVAGRKSGLLRLSDALVKKLSMRGEYDTRLIIARLIITVTIAMLSSPEKHRSRALGMALLNF
jgi:hypothetical protein